MDLYVLLLFSLIRQSIANSYCHNLNLCCEPSSGTCRNCPNACLANSDVVPIKTDCSADFINTVNCNQVNITCSTSSVNSA